MVLPVDAIEASIDVPEIVEVKSNLKSVRIVYRATLRNNGEETRVLHVPSTDHRHFWHLFDEDLNEVDRERGAGRGGEKDDPRPIRYRGLTLAPGQEIHDTHTIRIDPKSLLSGSNRWLLRVHLWGQTAEAEFNTVVRPTPLRAVGQKKRAVAKRPAQQKSAKRKATAKKPARKKTAKRKAAAKKPARKKTAAKKTAAKKTAARRRPARKAAARKRSA